MVRIPTPLLPQPIPKVLNQEEIIRLVRVSRKSPRNLSIVLTLLDTGVRSQELCDIELDSVDLKSRTLNIRCGKGGKDRVVYLSNITARAISRWLSVRPNDSCDNALFLSYHTRERLDGDGLRHLINRLADKAGIKNSEGKHISPSTLRKTFATSYISNGGDVHSLARLLGHSTIRTAQYYVYLAGGDVKNIHRKYSPISRLNLGR